MSVAVVSCFDLGCESSRAFGGMQGPSSATASGSTAQVSAPDAAVRREEADRVEREPATATESDPTQSIDAQPRSEKDPAETGVGPKASSCDELKGQLLGYADESSRCHQDDECRAVSVDCDSGLGACSLPVNASFDGAVVKEYERAAYSMACAEQQLGVCECSALGGVVCQEGRCVFQARCGAYDLGERWVNGENAECYCDAHMGIRCKTCGDYYPLDQWRKSDGCLCSCTPEGMIRCAC